MFMLTRTILSIATAAALLAGCGGSDTNSGYGWQYDAISDAGVRVQYHTATKRRAYLSIETLDSVYLFVERCTGISAPGPFVVILDHDPIEGHLGRYEGALIAVRATDPTKQYMFDTSFGLVSADGRDTFRWLLAHEYVHYLLWTTGFPGDRNAAHNHDFFTTCAVDPYLY